MVWYAMELLRQRVNNEKGAEIVEWENRLKISYLIADAVSGHRLARATTTQVAVEIANHEMCFVSPPVLFEKLGVPPS